MNKENIGYKKALVIFIDILGSQNRNNFNELLEINELFHDQLLNNKNLDRDYVAYQRHIYTFSDCAYIFYDFKDNYNIDNSIDNLGSLFDVALSNCEPLLMKFLSKGLIFRGGVSYGDVYYDNEKSMFFGEAVNKAYQYESSVAIYPRIIVDKYVGDTIITYNETIEKRHNNHSSTKTSSIKPANCIVDIDTDQLYYLNYFRTIQAGLDYSNIIKQSNSEFISNILTFCEHNISQYASNDRIRSKYEWLKKYIENSSNKADSKKPVFQGKPFWDELYNIIKPDDRCIRMHRNVGISLDDTKLIEILKTSENCEIKNLLEKYNE